jgi:hypothetical protein
MNCECSRIRWPSKAPTSADETAPPPNGRPGTSRNSAPHTASDSTATQMPQPVLTTAADKGTYLDTCTCNINKNRLKIIKRHGCNSGDWLRTALRANYKLRRRQSTAAEERLRCPCANQWYQNTQATRLAGLHSAPKRYVPSCQLPMKGTRKDICTLAAARHPGALG